MTFLTFALVLVAVSFTMVTAVDRSPAVSRYTRMMQPSGAYQVMFSNKRSCQEIKSADSNAPSGEYYVMANSRLYLVYCEMSVGYTFLHPSSIVRMQDSDIQLMFKDKKYFLMRTMRSDGTQTYAILQQHTSFRSSPLKIGLSQYSGYLAPVNKGPYLFFGFIPKTLAARRSTQGLNVNNQNLQFNNCDGSGNSHIALFPNFAEQPMKTLNPNSFSRNIFLKGLRNPSTRMMPVDYFMFAELSFGGCGCLSTSDKVHNTVVATTIGFG